MNDNVNPVPLNPDEVLQEIQELFPEVSTHELVTVIKRIKQTQTELLKRNEELFKVIRWFKTVTNYPSTTDNLL